MPDGGWRPGGSVVYGACLAARWGFQPAVLTAAAENDEALSGFPDGAALEVLASEATTTFRNLPGTPRVQEVSAVAAPLPPQTLPRSWKAAATIFVAPIIGEVQTSFLRQAAVRGLRGVGLQGWLRQVDAAGKVQPVDLRNVDAGALVANADAVFVSEEDLAATPSAEAALIELAGGENRCVTNPGR